MKNLTLITLMATGLNTAVYAKAITVCTVRCFVDEVRNQPQKIITYTKIGKTLEETKNKTDIACKANYTGQIIAEELRDQGFISEFNGSTPDYNCDTIELD